MLLEDRTPLLQKINKNQQVKLLRHAAAEQDEAGTSFAFTYPEAYGSARTPRGRGVMKILGLSCGRKMGNAEILVKQALMGAEEVGAEVEIMRLMDLHIKPCRGCESCTGKMAKGEPAECVIEDDDIPFMMEKFGQFDGLVIGSPVYFLAPPGYLKVLTDRMIAREVNVTVEAARNGERKRPVGLISVGGGNRSWIPMGTSLMKLLTFTEFATVDQLQVTEAARPGQVLLDDKAMEKARILGKRVAEAASDPRRALGFMGDEPGICPVCQSNMIVHLTPGLMVECPICGARGTLTLEGGNVAMVLAETDPKTDRVTLAGRLQHFMDIKETHEKYYANIDEVRRREEKYKSYLQYTLPPSAKNKGSAKAE
jgi:multimeric flavodoxin WrbA